MSSVITMLNYRNPDYLHVGRYLEKFSEYKTGPRYSIGQQDRWIGRSASASALLGPGQYRTDRDFPENLESEVGKEHVTRGDNNVAPRYTMAMEERVAPDGALKGISCHFQKKPNMLGPGQYVNIPRLGSRFYGSSTSNISLPKAAETQEAVRERKRRGGTPGPGVYDSPTFFDEFDRDRSKVIRKLAKQHGRRCWASQQYSHMFTCMKPREPRSSSMTGSHSYPSLPALTSTSNTLGNTAASGSGGAAASSPVPPESP